MQQHQLFRHAVHVRHAVTQHTLLQSTTFPHTITTYIDFLHCNHTCTHNICSPCSNASAIFMQLYHNMQRHYVTSIIVLAMCHLHISYFSPCISCCSVFCRHACTHLTASVIFSALCNLVASTFSPCNYKYATRGLHQLPFPSPHLHQTLCGLPPHSPNLHSLCPAIPILASLSSTHLPLSEHQARWHLAAHGGTARGQRRRCTCGRQFSSSTRSSAWSLSPPSSTLPPWLPSSWKSLWPSTLLSSSVWLSRSSWRSCSKSSFA